MPTRSAFEPAISEPSGDCVFAGEQFELQPVEDVLRRVLHAVGVQQRVADELDIRVADRVDLRAG